MAKKFGNLRLQTDVIRYGQRAYTLEGVSASVYQAPVEKRSGRSHYSLVRRLLSVPRHLTSPRNHLAIAGPGFTWLIGVHVKDTEAAQTLADEINRASRGDRTVGSEHASSSSGVGSGTTAAQQPLTQTDSTRHAGVDNNLGPELFEHVFAADNLNGHTDSRNRR